MKNLKQKWYKILKAEGFKDIENEYGMLHSWDSFRFSDTPHEHFINVREKYLDAEQLPNRYEIRNPTELQIWTLYSDGLSYREIGKAVGKNKDHVQKVIWKLNSILSSIKRQDERSDDA